MTLYLANQVADAEMITKQVQFQFSDQSESSYGKP